MRWNEIEGYTPDSQRVQHAIKLRRPVLRWDYYCAGVHELYVEGDETVVAGTIREPRSLSRDASARLQDGQEDEEDMLAPPTIGESQGDSDEDWASEVKPRWSRCPTKVKVRVSRTVNSLNDCRLTTPDYVSRWK